MRCRGGTSLWPAGIQWHAGFQANAPPKMLPISIGLSAAPDEALIVPSPSAFHSEPSPPAAELRFKRRQRIASLGVRTGMAMAEFQVTIEVLHTDVAQPDAVSVWLVGQQGMKYQQWALDNPFTQPPTKI